MKWIKCSNGEFSANKRFTIETKEYLPEPYVLREIKTDLKHPHLKHGDFIDCFKTIKDAKEAAEKYI